MPRLVIATLWLVGMVAQAARESNCPEADPNDAVPDDAALQACLARDPTMWLDPPTALGPGYLLATGLNLVNNTFISSSSPPQLAVLLAHASLAWPMVTTNAVVVNITLSFLRVDGNRDARNVTNAVACQPAPANINYVTSNILLPGYVFDEAPTWRCWDPWERFVSDVTIVHCVIAHSPCGAGIGLSGRNIYIAQNQIVANGWDPLHNPQHVQFPYSDGLNCAVCTNATVEYNTFIDATNMVIAVGPGPFSLYQHNTIVISGVQSQNAINVWPTNRGEPVSFWHPEPWSFAHSAIYNNSIRVMPSVTGDVGMASGLAIGGLPWSSVAVEDNAGLVLNNAIDSVNVGVLVDGVLGGTVFGNIVTNPYGGGSPGNCPHPLVYTVADTSNTLLAAGFQSIAFRQGPCAPVASIAVSAIDDAVIVQQSLNGIVNPAVIVVATNAAVALEVSVRNSGTSTWQGMVGGLGVKLGALINVSSWGVSRAPLALAAVVEPGQLYNFSVSLLAPAVAGSYYLQFQMVHELISWFGASTQLVGVTVETQDHARQ